VSGFALPQVITEISPNNGSVVQPPGCFALIGARRPAFYRPVAYSSATTLPNQHSVYGRMSMVQIASLKGHRAWVPRGLPGL